MRVTKISGILTLLVLFSACAPSHPVQVHRMSMTSLFNEDRALALLTGTPHDADILRVLAERGFAVKRSINHSVAQPKYALSVFLGERIDYCIDGKSVDEEFAKAVFEVSNMSSNKIVFSIETAGWTKAWCPLRDKTSVWLKLADTLDTEWR